MDISWDTGRRTIFALALGVIVAASTPCGAVDTPTPSIARSAVQAGPVRVPRLNTRAAKPKPALIKRKGKAAQSRKLQKRSDAEFIESYRVAHTLIVQKHDHAAGIAALRALGRDSHPDVANLIGFASRKLERYDDAKHWYEKALAADPNHTRTWSYYGMWHAEQGNRLKAEEFLDKVRSLCGNVSCREYVELKGVIEGTRVY